MKARFQIIHVIMAYLLIVLMAGCITQKSSTTAKAVTYTADKRKAPEIVSKNPQDELIKLSDSKGKLILLEFWGASSNESRKNHTQIELLYNNMKNKVFKNADGFTVFSVSLDTDKDKWLQALHDDGVSWQNQANDLKGWYSEAALSYDVNTLPKYFIIDGDGHVAEMHVSINNLEDLLRKRIK
jgi:hypothetical protein